MTHILTLEIPEQVYEPLVKAAERTGKTPEEVALEYLAEEVARFENDPLEKFIGAFDSGVTDLGARHDEYIGENLLRELRGEEGSE
jgi:hypothetical protein